MLELSKDEKAMIMAFREANEIPANAVLWYLSGLKGSYEKIKGIEPDRDTSILERIQIVRDVFNQLSK